MEAETDSERAAQVEQVKALTKAVHSVLHAQGREVQAMVLVDCVALWIAAHFGPEEEVQGFRKEMMAMFMKGIWMMIPVNERILRESMTDADKAEMAVQMEFLATGKRKH